MATESAWFQAYRVPGLSTAVFIAGMGVFQGCATAPSPTTEEVVEQALPDTVIRSDWAVAAEQGTVPDGWLKTFNDPRMESVVGEALNTNLNLRGVAAQLEAAEASARLAGAQLKPTIGLGGTANLQNTVGGGGANTSYGANVSVAWELDVWGRLRSLRNASEEAFRAAAADFDYARESLAAQTAKAYYLAIESKQQMNLARDSVDIFQQLYDLVSKRQEQGRVGRQDVALASADLNSAKERLIAAEGAFSDAVRSLEILLGRYPSAELEVADDFVPLPPPIPVGLPSEILSRRADIVAAERRVGEAFQNVEAARLAKLPSISLTGAGGLTSNDLNDLLGQGPGFFSLGANFFQPIYQGGAIDAQIEIETARQEAALAAYGQKALVAFGEVESALNNENLLDDRASFQALAVADSAEAARLARRQFEVGKINMLNVLQIQSSELAARSILIRLENARLMQRINLYLAIGGGYEEATEGRDEDA